MILSGRDVGRIPFGGLSSDLYWWVSSTLLTVDAPLGRRLNIKNAGVHRRGTPLQRLTATDISRAGVQRVPRTEDILDGKPRLQDGRVVDVAVVIWATGCRPDFSWIDLAVFGAGEFPVHDRGVVRGEPGLYFLGLPLQYTLNSSLIGGAGADARYLAGHLRRRSAAAETARAWSLKHDRPSTGRVGAASSPGATGPHGTSA